MPPVTALVRTQRRPAWARHTLATAVAALLTGLAATPGQAVTYTALDTGLRGTATGLNASGQIVGQYYNASGATAAFLWTPCRSGPCLGMVLDGTVLDLSAAYAPAGWNNMSATGLNNNGTVVGTYGVTDPAYQGQKYGFMRDASSGMASSIIRPYSHVSMSGVNDSGIFAGSDTTSGPHKPFAGYLDSFDMAQTTALASPTSGGAITQAVNSRGQIAGFGFNLGETSTRALLWDAAGQPTLLPPIREGTLGFSSYARASALNDSGWVVGTSSAGIGIGEHATLWSPGGWGVVDLTPDSPYGSNAVGINNRNQVIGFGASYGRSFMWSESGGAVALNGLMAPGAPTNITAAAINNNGQIVGTDVNGHIQLLTPGGSLSWLGRGGGSFSDTAQWELGFSPNDSRFDVLLAPAASQTVVADRNASMHALSVGSAGSGQVTLRLASGAVLSTATGTTLQANGVLTGDGQIVGGLLNYGTVIATPGATLGATGSLDNRGIVTGSGRIAANLVNRGAGQGVRVGAGQSLTFVGGSHTNANGAAIEVRDGGDLRFSGTIANQANSFIQISGGTLRLDNTLINNGQVQISYGGAQVFGVVLNQTAGKVIATGGSNTTFWGAMTNDGEVRASAGSHAVYFGAVNGTGTFTTNGTGAYHRFEGGYTPGHSPALVELGDVQFGSELEMELAGLTPGTQHDKLVFTGSVLFDVGSTLRVSLLDGFTPRGGQVFDLFDYAQAPQGQFDGFVLPALGAGLSWDTSDLYAGGELRVLATAVPEPSGWALWLAGLGLLGSLARRRAARV